MRGQNEGEEGQKFLSVSPHKALYQYVVDLVTSYYCETESCKENSYATTNEPIQRIDFWSSRGSALYSVRMYALKTALEIEQKKREGGNKNI